MKKINQRRPKPKPLQAPAARQQPPAQGGGAQPAHAEREERKVGIVSGTHADVFDEANEHKHDKWVAILISILAVLIAFAEVGNTDMMKVSQHAGIQANDAYAFYQAKQIRQSQLKVALRISLELKAQEIAEPAGAREEASGSEERRLRQGNRAAGVQPQERQERATGESGRLRERAEHGACEASVLRLCRRRLADRHRAGLRLDRHRECGCCLA